MFTHTTGSAPAFTAMAVMRSMRNGSVTGMARDATITIRSIFATGGREKAFFLGKTASITPSSEDRAVYSARSPTRGLSPVCLNLPRARQRTVLPPSST